jgi:hypothetical protein
MSDSLFDMDSVRMDSPRLVLLKAYDIQTHHAPQMPEDPWRWSWAITRSGFTSRAS